VRSNPSVLAVRGSHRADDVVVCHIVICDRVRHVGRALSISIIVIMVKVVTVTDDTMSEEVT